MLDSTGWRRLLSMRLRVSKFKPKSKTKLNQQVILF